MSAASTSIPILLGPTLGQRRTPSSSAAAGPSRQTLVSVKYNFKPPSIPKESVGLLHCPKRQQSEWLLEYATSANGAGAQESGAHGFIGTQSTAKDVDCVLVWNDKKQAYILDRLASNVSLKLDRSHSKLSKTAQNVLPDIALRRSERMAGRNSALGLDIPNHELEAESQVVRHGGGGDHVNDMEVEREEKPSEDLDMQDDGNDDFARQLQYDLEAIGADDEGGDDEQSDDGARKSPARNAQASQVSPKGMRTGLGLIGANGLQEDVITPRGSPFIDRSTRVPGSAPLPSAPIMRATPGMSPISVATSPRTTGLESSLSAAWKPPAQRSNVALAFDDDEDDEDDEDESDEEDDDDDDDDEDDEEDNEGDGGKTAAAAENAPGSAMIEDDDDDLDAFARQLEGSLMEPPTPVEEKQAKPSRPARRSSTRSKK